MLYIFHNISVVNISVVSALCIICSQISSTWLIYAALSSQMFFPSVTCLFYIRSPALAAPWAVKNAIGLGAAFWMSLFVPLYLLKAVMYPRKVQKEWQSNIDGNAFAVPFINLVLFAYLVEDK
jgi:hypothetical protein